MREIAIIGATASGKSNLAFDMAKREDSYILSIDSLSVYKEIDIVSAKPSKEMLSQIHHFGINEISPNQSFNVVTFIEFYYRAKKIAEEEQKNLIIVGGTSFYLKSLLTGISSLPQISSETTNRRNQLLQDIKSGWEFLYKYDSEYALKIGKNDRYRLEKAIDILLETGETPTVWFQTNRPKPIISNEIDIINISVDRDSLRKKIKNRTEKMFKSGVIDEVAHLINKYGKQIQPIKAIGIKEIVQYLNGEIENIDEVKELITIHTSQLAKRQTTFNRTQFKEFNIIEKKIDEKI